MILEIFLYVLTLLAARGRKQQSMFPPSHAQELLPCVSACGVSSWRLRMLEHHQASGCLRRPQPKSFCKQGRVVCFGPKRCVLCGPKVVCCVAQKAGLGLAVLSQRCTWQGEPRGQGCGSVNRNEAGKSRRQLQRGVFPLKV